MEALLPILLIVPLVAGAACFICRKPRGWEAISLGGFALTAALTVVIALRVAEQGTLTALGGFLRVDALSATVLALTGFVSLVCAIYAIGYFRCDKDAHVITDRQLKLYYVLAPLFVFAMLLSLMVDNLGVMWVAIESTTLASVLLVTFYNKKTSFEAGWKYAILGSVGISLALFGTVVTYSSAVGVLGEHAHEGMSWAVLSTIADKFNPTQMKLAFIFVLLGYGTKAGLVPMHTWKPDAYAEAPVPAATLLGAGFINCAIYSIMRFDVLAEKCLGHAFPSTLLIGFGICSIMLAAPFVLVQRSFRRLLAYSSIDHAGIMVAAIGFGGKLGLLGAMLHMVFHAITKPLLFFCAGNVQQQFGTPLIRRVHGVTRTLPWTAGLFLLGALAVTGTPPFSLFQSEFTTLSAAVDGGHGIAATLFIAGVVTIFIGFLKHMAGINLGKAPESGQAKESPWKLAAMLLVAITMVVVAFWLPEPLQKLINRSTHILGGACE